MKSITLDIEDPSAIRAFAAKVIQENPALNVLINNAGIMRPEDLRAQQPDLADAEAIVTTNLLGPIRLTAALLPHLRKQAYSAVMNVSSDSPLCRWRSLQPTAQPSRDPLLQPISALPAQGNDHRSIGIGSPYVQTI